MESHYKRDISNDYFMPLKGFHYNPSVHPSVANNRQLALVKNLHRSYSIAEGNLLRLIVYADIALSYATESEIQLYYSDLQEIASFEHNPEPINKVVFRGENKAFEITNPYLIDELYKSMLNLIDFRKIIKNKHSKKKRPSGAIIKKIATELFHELTEAEGLSEWKSLCVIGYIFRLYGISLKSEDPILTEDEYKKQTFQPQPYLTYLSGRIKRYINN